MARRGRAAANFAFSQAELLAKLTALSRQANSCYGQRSGHSGVQNPPHPLVFPAFLCYNEAKKGGGILQEIKTKALELIDQYKERLASKGITVITMLWYLFLSKL